MGDAKREIAKGERGKWQGKGAFAKSRYKSQEDTSRPRSEDPMERRGSDHQQTSRFRPVCGVYERDCCECIHRMASFYSTTSSRPPSLTQPEGL